MQLIRSLLVALLLAALSTAGWAQDDEGGQPGAAIYIPLKPAFVVNYGGQGRLRYLKVEVSVRVASVQTATHVRHHMPYIRNELILLFSRQSQEDLETQEGKELMRQQAHEAIEQVLLAEEGSSDLVEVYFNQLVVQG